MTEILEGSRVVIVRLMGGLGNQMFQYALGRRLAISGHTDLKLDSSAYQTDKFRSYRLGHFNFMEEFARPDEVRALAGLAGHAGMVGRVATKAPRIYNRLCPTYVVEQCFGFDPSVLQLGGNVYLSGYWQSEKYFADIEDVIRAELSVSTPADPVNTALAERISSIESISLHVRRGDYASDSAVRRVHGVCSLDYYHAGIKLLSERLSHPHFFVFSDDHEWAENNLVVDARFTAVSHNDVGRDYEDLRLMSLCKHHIIANSSFSWWGAWLSRNPSKIVVAPRRWFASSKFSAEDLVPDSWLKL